MGDKTADGRIQKRDVLWSVVAMLGIACCLVLTGTFDTILASQTSVASFDYRIAGTPLSGNTPVVIASGACALLAWRMCGLWRPNATQCIALAALQAASCCALFLPDSSYGWAAIVAWYTLQGCAIVQLVLWANTVARIGRERALALFACALFVDCLANIAEHAMPPSATAAFVTGAALVSPLALERYSRMLLSPAGLYGGTSEENDAVAIETIPLRLSMASLAFFGIAVGGVQSNGGATVAASADLPSLTIQLTTALVAVGLFALSLRFRKIGNPDVLLRVFLLAVLMIAVYLVGAWGSSSAGVGMAAASVARTAVFAYIWVLACESLPHPTRAAFVFACGWGTFTLAQTLSTKLGLWAAQAGGLGFGAYTLLVVGSLVGLVLINTLPQAKANPSPQGPSAPPVSTSLEVPDLYERGCERLARAHDLTPRKAQVLLPLVRGRSNPSIAASLTVGAETVRTHVRHIYQKTGIHSREELMNTVERLGASEDEMVAGPRPPFK